MVLDGQVILLNVLWKTILNLQKNGYKNQKIDQKYVLIVVLNLMKLFNINKLLIIRFKKIIKFIEKMFRSFIDEESKTQYLQLYNGSYVMLGWKDPDLSSYAIIFNNIFKHQMTLFELCLISINLFE